MFGNTVPNPTRWANAFVLAMHRPQLQWAINEKPEYKRPAFALKKRWKPQIRRIHLSNPIIAMSVFRTNHGPTQAHINKPSAQKYQSTQTPTGVRMKSYEKWLIMAPITHPNINELSVHSIPLLCGASCPALHLNNILKTRATQKLAWLSNRKAVNERSLPTIKLHHLD